MILCLLRILGECSYVEEKAKKRGVMFTMSELIEDASESEMWLSILPDACRPLLNREI